MKLKVVILASSIILSINLFANTNLWYIVHPMPSGPGQILINVQTIDKAFSFEEAKKVYNRYFPVSFTFTSIPTGNLSREKLLENLQKTNSIATAAFYLNNSYISNTVSGVVYDSSALATGNEYNFINASLRNARQLDKGCGALLKNNSLVAIKYVSGTQYNALVNFDSFFYNVINNPSILTAELINENLEVIKQNLGNVSGSLSDLLTVAEAIEMNQLNTQSTLGNIIGTNAAITNLLDHIWLTTYNQKQEVEIIKNYIKPFSDDYKIKQLASGQIFNTLNNSYGPIYEALDQLVRLNMFKQGINLTELDLENMSDSDKWINSGMAAKYGSFSDNFNNRNIGMIVGAEAIKENENFQNKINTLSQLSDENGNVVDPLTGELTKLNNALKNWDKSKVDGALANYQYNNPAATNGFFGHIKKNLTEEGDWRLLDKKFKDNADSFMGDLSKDGVKINTTDGPIEVIVKNEDSNGIIVNVPTDTFINETFRTKNDTLDSFYDNWIDFRVLWSKFTGVETHSDRGYLELMSDSNNSYYSYVTNNMFFSVSNQLAKLIELNHVTNKANFVEVPRSTYVRYLMRGIGTTENNDDELFAIRDEPTFTFDGSTNFEQAVAFQLHDLFEVSQNGSKADMMSADFIRGIYRLLGTGSNLVSQLEYITNTVYKANGLSTDSNDYSNYEQEKEKLESDLDDVNTILEDMKLKSEEKINFISVRLFADYTLPNTLTLLEFNDQRFEIDLYKWDKIFLLMHNCSLVAWLAVGLLMLPRVIYMLLCFGLKMLGKFYNIMRS